MVTGVSFVTGERNSLSKRLGQSKICIVLQQLFKFTALNLSSLVLQHAFLFSSCSVSDSPSCDTGASVFRSGQ